MLQVIFNSCIMYRLTESAAHGAGTHLPMCNCSSWRWPAHRHDDGQKKPYTEKELVSAQAILAD
jgi:hypothetical protein